LSAVGIAAMHGLSILLVFNTGGYDRVATLKLLEGITRLDRPQGLFAFQ